MMDIKTIFNIIKNFRSYKLNRDLIGFHDEEVLAPIQNEDVIAFADATKDDNSLYQEQGLVPPFFLAKLAFPLMKRILCHKDLGLNILKVVMAQQEIKWHEPLKTGNQLNLIICIKNIHDTAAGEMIELYLQAKHDLRIKVKSTIGFIVRAKKKEKKSKVIEEKVKQAIFSLQLQTNQGQELKFAQISGDHNFIHTSNLLARAAGFPGRIMHGACAMAMICSALVKNQLNSNITRLLSLSGRLAKPVIPGDRLTIKGYESSNSNDVHFEVLNSDETIVFKDGILKYKQ